jgi:pimeloyl-[acyl-carrier protein] methyl ester esterase
MDITPKNWIFLRGLARETRHWGKFPEMFQQSFPGTFTQVLEIPGVGKKYREKPPIVLDRYADLLREEFLQLKQERTGDWGILAISMGSMIAMLWANRYPHDFTSGIFINSSAGNLSSIKERFSVEAMKMVGNLFFKEDYEQREKAILELTTHRKSITGELIKEYSNYSRQFPIKRAYFLRQIYAASRFKVPSKLPFDPILLNGQYDSLASPVCSEILANHFQVPFYRDTESGHDLPLDHPEWIIDTIGPLLK